MSDIVDRLRLLVPSDSSGAAFDGVNEITRLTAEVRVRQTIVEEARDERDAAFAEVEKLRAALEEIIQDSFSVYAIQVARAALSGDKQ